MAPSRPRTTNVLSVFLAWCALLGGGLAGSTPAAAAPLAAPPGPASARPASWSELAPGVGYATLDLTAEKGPVRAHLLSVDLTEPKVSIGLLHPGEVAARAPLSALADAQAAVGGVNGDFFHISETQHPGVEATGAAVGPAVAEGRALKSAVPNGQRFGPALPPGTSTRDVLGVGADDRARLGALELDGTVTAHGDQLPLGGLNQYALPVGSVGVFTSDWGEASRLRATCGTDTSRSAPCSSETYEVTVRAGRVTAVAEQPGRGRIAEDTEVLVGREAGARELRRLAVGDPVSVRHRLVAERARVPYRFAVGGFPVLRDGAPLDGLDSVAFAVRSAAGIGFDGRWLVLMALDGAPGFRSGLTVAEVADLMASLGTTDALSLDGGGSSTLVTRSPGDGAVTVRNHPSGGAERPVANGIGVFAGG
ncbi:phosphodiester glycosidase family protein [Streptomyces sp. NPDC048629]|uniref:phosphodiester glycosidase family protein n=1 Tax=Streptomyces sp. NPDC048629 TaxID=3154824 RepID=UPI0034147344